MSQLNFDVVDFHSLGSNLLRRKAGIKRLADQDFYIIQCYRLEPGDVGKLEFPTVGENLVQAEKTAADLLLSYYTDKNRPASQQPHHARIIDHHGKQYLRLMVDGDRKVRRVLEPI